MENRLIWEDQTEGIQKGQDQALKATALLYLADALESEAFEQAPDIIQKAKGFGADQADIDTVLSHYLFGDGGGQNAEGDIKFNGRKRF